MRILIGNDWREGYLDEHRLDGDVRIRTHALMTVDTLHDLYFVRERSLWRLWNYFREVGLLWVIRKVISRSKESSRNQKFLSVGLGVVVEAPGFNQSCLAGSRSSASFFLAISLVFHSLAAMFRCCSVIPLFFHADARSLISFFSSGE